MPPCSARVEVRRLAYRRRGHANLHPADGVLNLPAERHSHGLRRLAALEAARGSFDGAVEAIGRASGQQLGKRQVEDLAQRAAVDFADFYARRCPPDAEQTDVVMISCDGKGIVMRPEALRPATAKAAAAGTTKLATRLSKGEKRNRKRMAASKPKPGPVGWSSSTSPHRAPVRSMQHRLDHRPVPLRAQCLMPPAGRSVKAVSKALGHASAATTLNLYSHLWLGDEDRIRDAVDLALAPKAEDRLRTEGEQ